MNKDMYVFIFEFRRGNQLVTHEEKARCESERAAHDHFFQRAKSLGITASSLRRGSYKLESSGVTLGYFKGQA